MPYEAPDFFQIDELLTEDERMIRDMVRDWVTERIIPHIGDHYMAGTFPDELIPEMAELGEVHGLPQHLSTLGPNPIRSKLEVFERVVELCVEVCGARAR